jgi:aminoglycoside 6-adenylyltransferase
VNEIDQAYEQLIERFVGWAQAEDNVRAAVVIGSRARRDHPADEWSDLDVVIFAREPASCWREADWLHELGDPWLTFVEPTPDGRGFERRVLFAGGLDVDFAPSSVAGLEALLDQGFPPDIADIISRGARFLVDKDDFAARLAGAEVEAPGYSPPAEPQFLNLVHDFWYHTAWTAKHLRRGELWWAKGGCDGYLKDLLRQMLEWHAQACRGEDVDTWMRGRFLEEWADPRAVAALPQIFAHYDEDDVWRALLATMDLFRWLSVETADRLGYAYPSSGAAHAAELVEALLSGRPPR